MYCVLFCICRNLIAAVVVQVQEHKREVERLIAEKRAMYEAARAAEEAEAARRAAEEARKAAIVEEQRRMLLEEAADLAGFLPRGVLRDDRDLQYVQQRMGGMSMGDSKRMQPGR
jgi:predicted phage gp36 major capsid-like protein